jgi:hypothetical protein
MNEKGGKRNDKGVSRSESSNEEDHLYQLIRVIGRQKQSIKKEILYQKEILLAENFVKPRKSTFSRTRKKGFFCLVKTTEGLRSRSGGTSLGTLLESISSDETGSEEGRWKQPVRKMSRLRLGLF